jgi:tripartite-type tricarboxylate transporter receptor subunit TctC
VLAGDVKVVLTTPSDAINAYVTAGRLRMLAVSSLQRSPMLPSVPAIAETVPKFGVNAWFGISAPMGTPVDVVARLNEAVNKAIAEPAFQAKLTALGMTPHAGPPSVLGDLFRSDHQLWTSVIQKANILPE